MQVLREFFFECFFGKFYENQTFSRKYWGIFVCFLYPMYFQKGFEESYSGKSHMQHIIMYNYIYISLKKFALSFVMMMW